MVNQILITIVLDIFLCSEIYLLGKKISVKNNLFINNESAIWIVGIIAYLGFSFFIFLPFIWLNINIIYFVIIFIFKEIIILSYIFLGKERVSWASVNYKNLIYMLIMSLLIVFVFNFIIYFPEKEAIYLEMTENRFQIMWQKMQEVLKVVTSMPQAFINKWLIGFIGATIIYASINAFVLRFGKHQNIFEYSLSALTSLGFIFIFNFHENLHILIASYLTLFSIFIALNIVQFSRKRHSFIFVINFLVAWIINAQTFIALATIAITTAVIYLWMKKPMSSLFFVQLTTPILIVLASFISSFSVILSLGLIFVIIIYYVILVLIGKKQLTFKINRLLEKWSQVIPYLNSFIILLSSMLLIWLLPIDWKEIFGEKNLVFDYYFLLLNSNQVIILQILQWTIYVLTIIILISILLYWKYKNIKFIGIRTIMLIVFFIFIFTYNPLFNAILIALNLQENFTYLRAITFMPLFLFAIISVHNLLIKKHLIVS